MSIDPNKELLARIEAFDIDGGAVSFPFAARLTREEGWTPGFTARVISEYKRFIYLAMISEAPVCPPEAVDAAWHLHLTYTRSYWQRFCKETLGREIHHDPTRGGRAEDAKHWRMYEATLAAYAQAFGHPAPADIWPPVAKRFPLASKQAASSWRRTLLLPAAASGAGALIMLIAPGDLSPFDLRGTDFFYILLPAMLVATIIGRFIYRAQHGPSAKPTDANTDLDWQDAAYLLGGRERLTAATIAHLIESDAAEVSKHGGALEATGQKPDTLTAVERAVLAELPLTSNRKQQREIFAHLHARVNQAFADRAAELADRGLYFSPNRAMRAFLIALTPLALVYLLLGLPRLWWGIAAARPVGLLVVVLVGGLIAALFFIASAVNNGNMTWKGQAAVKCLSDRSEHLKDGKLIGKAGAATAGLAVAVFGTAALAGSELSDLARLDDFFPRRTESSGGCGGGGCGGGGCGGGGCGG